jgi:hypothetical protein
MIAWGVMYEPGGWAGFFSTVSSASAALTGLLFVAISINLSQIISNPMLTARAAKALSTLVTVLLTAIVCLVPGQPYLVLACEMIVIGVMGWILITRWQLAASRRNLYISTRQRIFQHVLAQGSTLPLIVGSISILLMQRGALYWIVVGMILSLVAALIDAWVLLVEIQR